MVVHRIVLTQTEILLQSYQEGIKLWSSPFPVFVILNELPNPLAFSLRILVVLGFGNKVHDTS